MAEATRPLTNWEEARVIANPFSGTDAGRTAEGMAIGAITGETINRYASRVPNNERIADLKTRMADFRSTRMDKGMPGTPGAPERLFEAAVPGDQTRNIPGTAEVTYRAAVDPVAERAPGLINPDAESPYRRGWFRGRATNQQALTEMERLVTAPNPGTRALRRYGVTTKTPRGKAGWLAQLALTLGGGAGAHYLGSKRE